MAGTTGGRSRRHGEPRQTPAGPACAQALRLRNGLQTVAGGPRRSRSPNPGAPADTGRPPRRTLDYGVASLRSIRDSMLRRCRRGRRASSVLAVVSLPSRRSPVSPAPRQRRNRCMRAARLDLDLGRNSAFSTDGQDGRLAAIGAASGRPPWSLRVSHAARRPAYEEVSASSSQVARGSLITPPRCMASASDGSRMNSSARSRDS
jgi:hypothetical protein